MAKVRVPLGRNAEAGSSSDTLTHDRVDGAAHEAQSVQGARLEAEAFEARAAEFQADISKLQKQLDGELGEFVVRAAEPSRKLWSDKSFLDREHEYLKAMLSNEVEKLRWGLGDPHQVYPTQSARIDGLIQTIEQTYSSISAKIAETIQSVAGLIGDENTSIYAKFSREEKLALLDQFASRFPGAPISRYAVALFPELSPRVGVASKPTSLEVKASLEKQQGHLPLPPQAPASWTHDRDDDDNPVDFVRRHYAPWIGNGLAKADLRRLDKSLYQALATWESRHPDERLNLPTRSEANQKWVERVRDGRDVPTSDLGTEIASQEARELERRAKAIRRDIGKRGNT